MPRHPCAFYQDESGFTGAERALLVCFGLAIVTLVGVLVRGGSGRAASDAARTLRDGSGSVGAMTATASLGRPQLLHAAGIIKEPAAGPATRPSGDAVPRGPAALAQTPPAPPPAQKPPVTPPAQTPPAAPPAQTPPATPPALAQGGLTIGDTAGTKRTFTDNVYKHNLTLTEKAQVSVTDPAMQADLARFVRNWEKNHARYEAVSAQTGVPAKLIAALHWRESGGNFNTYLHQGDPLGKPAVHVPRNIPIFYKWEDAAVNALDMKRRTGNDLGLTDKTTDLAAMATYSEYYNGLGYYNKGRVSPYVYSGTDQYQRGKYVADGVYDPNARDRQLGVITMLRAISTGVATPGPVATATAPPSPPAAGAPGPAMRAPRRYFVRRRPASFRARM